MEKVDAGVMKVVDETIEIMVEVADIRQIEIEIEADHQDVIMVESLETVDMKIVAKGISSYFEFSILSNLGRTMNYSFKWKLWWRSL